MVEYDTRFSSKSIAFPDQTAFLDLGDESTHRTDDFQGAQALRLYSGVFSFTQFPLNRV
jgi:hypothetical protein